jgi:hypothetical protein
MQGSQNDDLRAVASGIEPVSLVKCLCELLESRRKEDERIAHTSLRSRSPCSPPSASPPPGSARYSRICSSSSARVSAETGSGFGWSGGVEIVDDALPELGDELQSSLDVELPQLARRR